MKDRLLERIVPRRDRQPVPFDALIPRRISNVLLVSSLYDAYIFQEDGRLTEMLFSEVLELGLRHAPRIERASTAADALELLGREPFDLVISILRVGDSDSARFAAAVHELAPGMPLVLMASSPRELAAFEEEGTLAETDRVFVWSGDARLFLAIVKSVEDRLNVAHDTEAAGVPVLLLVEDDVRFYSSYLPLLYTELLRHTQALMADGLNPLQKLLRMRARPKILLATTFEEGQALHDAFREHLMGVIVDAAFPRGGRIDPGAGLDFARWVRAAAPDRPVLMQSSDRANAPTVEALGGGFIDKGSDTLLLDLRRFLREQLGFGDFGFRGPDGALVATAGDLLTLSRRIAEVPAGSLVHHARRNDFSTWLMARTEFDLARRLRPVRIEDIGDAEDLRRHLLEELRAHREQKRAGVVAELSQETFEGGSGFARIGDGSLGGKGRALAFLQALIERYDIGARFPGVEVSVPPAVVLTTSVWDEVLERGGLLELALAGAGDDEIQARFEAVAIPPRTLDALRTFLARVHHPLAVRSSSLLEDASYRPFAGVYRTVMLRNGEADPEARLGQLTAAIRLVWASTFLSGARALMAATHTRLEEEKMAVVIQQVAGRRHEDCWYPQISGTARSHNTYPVGDLRAEDGIAAVVLGLGPADAEGARPIRFSPAAPHRLYQLADPREALRTTQGALRAVDLSPAAGGPVPAPEGFVTVLDLPAAERHGTLQAVGSVHDAESDAIRDGLSRPGQRLVTMAGVLKGGALPLAPLLSLVLDVGRTALASPVEIEFAAEAPAAGRGGRLDLLQIRPVPLAAELPPPGSGDGDPGAVLCRSARALGHGRVDGIRDVVYVPAATFDRQETVAIAAEIGAMDAALRAEGRPYLLIGPGRWGTADRFLGIPVEWARIAGARVIVETDLPDLRGEPSYGSHFFQQMITRGIAYFTVDLGEGADRGFLDAAWLDGQPEAARSLHVRHLSFQAPLTILVDGRRQQGVVYKPGPAGTRGGERR